MPVTVANFSIRAGAGLADRDHVALGGPRRQPLYIALYVVMIVFFAFFYTAVVFNPKDTADNLKKYGGFIPGIRPGGTHSGIYRLRADADYRVWAAAYLALVCVIPEFLISYAAVPFYFGGTSLAHCGFGDNGHRCPGPKPSARSSI